MNRHKKRSVMSDDDDEYMAIPLEDIFAVSTATSIAEEFQKGVKEQADEDRERCISYKYAVACLLLISVVSVGVFVLCKYILRL